MKKILGLFVVVILMGPTVISEAANDPLRLCRDAGRVINGLAMTSSRSFSIVGSNVTGKNAENWGLMTVFMKSVDANTSVGSVTMTCTGSEDGNVTEYKLQDVSVSAGVGNSSNLSWVKTAPGTSNWIWKVDVEGVPDTKCAFTFAATPAAIDLFTVDIRMCTK